MKKTLFAALLGFAFATVAHAITYVDINADLQAFNSSHTSYTNEFNLLDAGYNPTAETITSACAVFGFTDLLGGSENFTVNLGGNLFNQGSFSIVLLLPTSVTANALFTLDQTGIISYTVTRNTGNFQLVASKLTADAVTRAVPDGGMTAVLLGLGVIGILAAKRRFGTA